MGAIRAFSRRARWTDAELNRLRASYASTPRSELRVHFPHRPIRAVECKANALGLVRDKAVKMTDEERLRRKREGMARRRAADPDAVRAYQRAHHKKHRERRNAAMRRLHRRRFFWTRAMHLRQEGRATASDLSRLWKRQRGRCALTGRRLTRENAHLDHIAPLARGGGDGIENLRWVCHEANLAKRALSDEQFVALCASVVRWIGQRIQEVDAL